MAIYRYFKEPTGLPRVVVVSTTRIKPAEERLVIQTGVESLRPVQVGSGTGRLIVKRAGNLLSLFFLVVGFIMVGMVVWPVVEYQWVYLAKAPKRVLVKPIPEVLAVSAAASPPASASGAAEEADLTKVSNWFSSAVQNEVSEGVTHYAIGIPKLGIKKAVVEIGGEDLTRSLIHWGGTANPGDLGNAVIFGHSCLPQFADPTDYRCIFAKLMDLNVGDEILMTFDGITYKYTVFELLTVEPEDISVLEQRFDDSYVTLITCVPPGTYWKRGVVRGRLTPV